MADICMCPGGLCSIKESCYRYTALASEYQSMFIEPPFQNKMDGTACGYYWDNRDWEVKK